MRKGIWQEFDGYQEIVEEIKVSRKLGGTVNTGDLSAEEYIRRLHPDKLELCVSEIVKKTPSTKTLRLVSGDHYLPPFQAGQYIALYPEIDGIRTSRPYSISSQPKQTGYYDITIRRIENGLVSNYLLDEVKRGICWPARGRRAVFTLIRSFIRRQWMTSFLGQS